MVLCKFRQGGKLLWILAQLLILTFWIKVKFLIWLDLEIHINLEHEEHTQKNKTQINLHKQSLFLCSHFNPFPTKNTLSFSALFLLFEENFLPITWIPKKRKNAWDSSHPRWAMWEPDWSEVLGNGVCRTRHRSNWEVLGRLRYTARENQWSKLRSLCSSCCSHGFGTWYHGQHRIWYLRPDLQARQLRFRPIRHW